MNKDKIIEKNIREKLEKEMVSYGVDINVRCINGHVTLYGIVDNLSEKNHAQKIAESVEGVEKDVSLVNLVVQKLSRYDLSLPDLVITANNGTVTLSGYVNNLKEKELANEAAQSVNGVKKVINHIKIREKS
ncbi:MULTISPECIES: BON domain-containing protein [Thermoanaerobacter]|uniref:Transport-associated n=2 Tax=Thermoanaerobacter TaxID=1754 RepID=B0KD24_THEP3|nr:MULTISPECIES: BON domain-containing protein [Thermoanaerobacter]ABY94122.1 transport-associated [Thermoanaerobacter pseudethanolicus ATCC 33223]ADV79075.1 transport-associated protein [Thermoanaerobacter brockii subsp. finnii Ako-1]HAA80976.1 BON domain-containing protein [Thermoanaerobacter sp.]HBW58900.1 BON domain-containing protein [Thermoanaerobacter sp.]